MKVVGTCSDLREVCWSFKIPENEYIISTELKIYVVLISGVVLNRQREYLEEKCF